MISGIKRSVLAVLLGALLPLSVFGQWDASHLLASLAHSAPERIAYSETRRMAYLDVPLKTHGVLEFRPPDTLRRTVQGSAESYLIVGDVLRVEGPGGTREVALDIHPGLRAFAESLRATLAGDAVRLQQLFRLELIGDATAWRLVLRPRDASVAQMISTIELSGTGTRLRRIETLEAGGDSTVTELAGAE